MNLKEALRRLCEGCLRGTDECSFILESLDKVKDERLLFLAAKELLLLAREEGCDAKELLEAYLSAFYPSRKGDEG